MNAVRERSRAYPGVALNDCVVAIQQIKRSLGAGEFDRGTIARALGLAEPTVTRPVAAMAHFGLLDKIGGNYRVSSLGKVLADPLDDELEPALRDALYRPTLYAEVLKAYEPEGRLPERLATVLHRNFGIAANASELASRILVKSAQLAGVIDDGLRFIREAKDERSVPATAVEPSSVTPNADDSALPNDRIPDGSQQRFLFRLSGGKYASLSVPGEITARDISIIRKQIELLEMQLDAG